MPSARFRKEIVVTEITIAQKSLKVKQKSKVKTMRKIYTEKWYGKRERELQEPIRNTKRYYGRRAFIKICSCIPPLIIWGIVQWVRVQKYLSRYIEFYNECLENGRAITNDGAPGAGKTFTGAQMAYFLARRQWDKLKSDYFTQRTMIAEWIKHGDTDKLSAFRALEESYRYYSDREQTHIPCLVSSIPLKEYGTQRMSYKLTAEIFLQIDRCPEYSVIFNDESGLGQGADKSKTDDQDVLSFWRFPRHFFDGFFVNTNQDGAQNAIFMRRSTDYLNHIKGQEWLLRPVRLEKRIARRERRYYKYIDRHNLTGKAYKKGQKLYYLKRYAATIGFRRVRHRLTTTSGEPVGEEREYIFPAIGGLDYDDRAYRNLYKCKDKAIDLAGWEKLVVDESTHGAFDRLVADKATA